MLRRPHSRSAARHRSILWSVLTLFVLTAGLVPSASAQSDLDAWIVQRMATARAPGLTAAVVRDSTVVWTGQYGLRNTDTQQPVLPETPFLVASVSKIVTATALMHLYGGEVGAYADLFFDPTTGIGVVISANADPANPDVLWSILERLFDEAPDLDGSVFADGFESGDLTAWTTVVPF